MNKLKLNKETIAVLTNPDRVFGGEGGADPTPPTNNTCVGNTCPPTCQGATCVVGATCDGQYTCDSPDPNIARCVPVNPTVF